MKSDQMGTGHNNPSPRELPLSNQARFNSSRGSRFDPTFPRWTTLPGAPNQIWLSGDRADASSARIGSGWQHGRKPSAADRPLSLASAGLPLNHPARQPSGDAQSEETEESHHGASYPINRQTFPR